MPSFQLYVPNMVCPACIAPINVLKSFDKVKSATPNFIDHTITLEIDELDANTDSYIKKLTESIDEVGFTCEGLLEITPFNATQAEEQDAKRIDFEKRKLIKSRKIIRRHWINGLLGTLLGAGFMLLCMFSLNIPMVIMYLLAGSITLFTVYFGKDTYKKAIQGVSKKQPFSMETLFAVSTFISLVVSCVSLFVPGLPMMFDAVLLILGFKNIGKAIEESIKHKISKKTFLSYAPRFITSEISPTITKIIPVKNLRPGNIIYVKGGETVPVDGICLTKNALIYNTIVTGRTVPQVMVENQIIYAGCVVPDNIEYIKIRVAEKEIDSYLAILDKRTQAAEREKSAIENYATKWLKYFVPTVFAIATLAFIAIAFIVSPVSAIHSAISILVSACPCTLGLITPLAMKTGIAKGADYGVSYKSGKSIEAASNIDTVVFDLNGTLTTGIPKVTRSTIPEAMLTIIKKMEAQSSHPIAKAIYKFCEEKKLDEEFKSTILHNVHHSGITALIDGIEYSIGNSAMMTDLGLRFDHFEHEIKQQNPEHTIYFAKNKTVIGYILLEDPLRKDAFDTIQELHHQGKQIHLCTGADYPTARKYADQLNIPYSNVMANCLGESKNSLDQTKTNYIQSLIKKGRKVAMIGDAGNDALAVANSHFGIAVQSNHGHAVTQDKAEAIIGQDSLWSVVNAFTIAKQTMTNINQNLWVSLGYNFTSMLIFGGLLLAIGFTLNPAIGAALMVVQTAFILMNLERFKRQTVVISPAEKFPQLGSSTILPTNTYSKCFKGFLKRNKTHEISSNNNQSAFKFQSPFNKISEQKAKKSITNNPKLLSLSKLT